MIACERGHPWVFAEGKGWARVESKAAEAVQIQVTPVCIWCGKTLAEHRDEPLPNGAVPRMPCLGLKSGFFAKPLSTDTVIEIDEHGKVHPPEAARALRSAAGAPFEFTDRSLADDLSAIAATVSPLHAVFNASPEARCVPRWLTGPVHHHFTPGALVCQCGAAGTNDGNTVHLRKEAANGDALVREQGSQEPPRGAGLARGSGSPPRVADLQRQGGPVAGGGAGVRPVPAVEDQAAPVLGPEGAEASETVAGGGEQAVHERAGSAAVIAQVIADLRSAVAWLRESIQFQPNLSAQRYADILERFVIPRLERERQSADAPPGYVAIPVEQLDRAARAAGCAWGVDGNGEFFLTRMEPGLITAERAWDREAAADPMAQERAWAQGRLADAEVRAAARHAETVELLKEEVRLLGLLRDAAYFGAPASAKMGSGGEVPTREELLGEREQMRGHLDACERELLEFASLLFHSTPMEVLSGDQQGRIKLRMALGVARRREQVPDIEITGPTERGAE